MPYCVPAIHPAYVLRQASPITDIIVADLAKGYRISQEGPRDHGEVVYVLPSYKYGLQRGFDAACRWLDHWEQHASWVAVDVETSGLDYFNCKLYSIALSAVEEPHVAVAFTLMDYHTLTRPMEDQLVWRLRTILANPKVGKIYHNAPFDQAVLYTKGFQLAGKLYDTMAGAHLVQSDAPDKTLGWVGQTYLDVHAWKVDHKGAKLAFTRDPDELLQYNGEDALYTAQIMEPQLEDIHTRGQPQAVIDLQIRLVEMATRMEIAGLPIDFDKRRRMSLNRLKKMAAAKHQLRTLLDWPDFNPMSDDQRRTLLYGPKFAVAPWNLGLRPTQFTEKTNLPATGAYAIIDFLEHPIVRALTDYVELRQGYAIQYRESFDVEIAKMKELGLDEELHDFKKNPPKHEKGGAYQRAIGPDGRLHPKWNPFAKSARFKSNPNVQNQKKKDRAFFKTAPDWTMVGSDKDQLELRVLACLAGVPRLLEEMRKPGGDPHLLACVAIYGERFWDYSEEDREKLRTMVKTTTYAAVYMGLKITVWRTIREKKDLDPALRAALTFQETCRIIDGYFGTFPEIERYHHRKMEIIAQRNYIDHPPFWRRHYFPVQPPPFNEVANRDIQSTAADVVGSEMCELDEEIRRRFPGEAFMIMHLHDQFDLECKTSHAEEIAKLSKKIFGNTRLDGPCGPVYLTASPTIADNLKDAK
uniref:Putative DNA polymerase n=1 Tax=viral metagenome TaxID=1070528 RepID=A0A6H1Z7M2_9ZZZZ